jgi:hypothetical protein
VSDARRGEEVDSVGACVGARQFSFSLHKTIPTFSLIQLLNQETWVLGFGAVSSAKVRLTQLPNLRDIGARLQPFPQKFFALSVPPPRSRFPQRARVFKPIWQVAGNLTRALDTARVLLLPLPRLYFFS